MKRSVVVVLIISIGIGWAGARFLGYLPTRVNDLVFVSLKPLHAEGDRDNLHLRFRSNENLRRLATRSGAFGAYANISLCPFHDNPEVSISRVSHNGVDLDTKPVKGCMWKRGKFAGCFTTFDTPDVQAEVATEDKTQGPFVYDAYFTYREQWLTYTNIGTSQRRIPLPSTVQDLCVKIHGDGGPPGLESNVFVIPKAELARALGPSHIPPLGPTTWHDDPSRLKCAVQGGDANPSVLIILGQNHGSELAIHRLSDDAWYVLVTDSPPADMRSIMSPREYAGATRLELPADVTGYKWWSADGKQEQIFTTAGEYVLYSSSNIENDNPGLGCSITFLLPRAGVSSP